MKILINSVLSLIILFCIPASRSAAQSTVNLSIDDLFRSGIENSLKIQSSYINKDIADNRMKTAKSTRYPDVSIGAAGGYIGQPLVFMNGLSDAERPYMPHWLQNYTVEATQPLFTGNKIKNNIEKTALEKQIAALNIEKDKADVKLLLIGIYLDLIKSYKQKEVFTHNINDAEHRLHDIRRMKEQGMLTTNDVIRSELQLTNYKLSLKETEDNISILSQQLDIALGMDETLILLPDTALLEIVEPLLSYDDYIMQAYEQYPELKIVRSEINLAHKDLQLAKSDYYPSLALHAGNTLQRPITSSSPPLDLFMNTWNITLSLSYKLSSLYKNNHNTAAAKEYISLQKIQEERQRQEIRLNVKAAYIKHQEALEHVTALTQSVAQANENYRIVQNRYFNQLAVLTDLLDASSVRLEAELQLTTAKANTIYTYYQLLKSSGNL